MAIGSLISGGATLLNGFLQRKAEKKAAEESARAREAGMRRVDASTREGQQTVAAAGGDAINAVQGAGEAAATGARTTANTGRDRMLESLGLLNPYTSAGVTATNQLTDATSGPAATFSFDPSSLGTDPGYLFRQKEANKAQLANGAAFGDLMSGGFAKAFQDRNQEAASQETDKVYGRQRDTFDANQTSGNNRISQLMQIMGIGRSAAGQQVDTTGDASRLEYQGEHDAGGYGVNAAQLAAMFGMDSAKTSAQLGQRGAEAGADLLTGAGDARAVGTANQSNTTGGILQTIGNMANIDWSSIFKKKPSTPAYGSVNTSGPALALGGG